MFTRASIGSMPALRWTALLVLVLVPARFTHAAEPSPNRPDWAVWVSRCEGAWAGNDNTTPLGRMPFALVFDREADGSLHAHTASSAETWVDLRLHSDAQGRWLLTEGGRLAGLGEQWHTLGFTRSSGDTLDFADLEHPDYLRCRLAVASEQLFLLVHVRGREHARFVLPRVNGDAANELRRALAAAATQPEKGQLSASRSAPGEPYGTHESASAPVGTSSASAPLQNPDPIATARAGAQARPQDVEAQLGLARALGVAIRDAEPMQKAAYAIEMRATLERAVGLDSTSAPAQYALAQYYLRAPEIAGGSTAKAGKSAATLQRLGSPLAEVVEAQLEVRRGEASAAAMRLRRVLRQHPELQPASDLLATLATPPK